MGNKHFEKGGEPEFNLSKERERWFDKWMNKRLTCRAIAEFKQTDKEFIKLLKDESFNDPDFTYGAMVVLIDKLAGDKLK